MKSIENLFIRKAKLDARVKDLKRQQAALQAQAVPLAAESEEIRKLIGQLAQVQHGLTGNGTIVTGAGTVTWKQEDFIEVVDEPTLIAHLKRLNREDLLKVGVALTEARKFMAEELAQGRPVPGTQTMPHEYLTVRIEAVAEFMEESVEAEKV